MFPSPDHRDRHDRRPTDADSLDATPLDATPLDAVAVGTLDGDAPLHVVALTGELDLGTRSVALEACTAPDHVHVLVDLSALSFLDCAGLRALDGAAAILAARGGSLVVTNAVGEPRRLLSLIGDLGGVQWTEARPPGAGGPLAAGFVR